MIMKIARSIPATISIVAGSFPIARLPDWMKPNNAKVIVIFNKFTWNGLPVDLAVPVGKRIPPRALKWLQQFSEENMRPLIYTEQLEVNGAFQKNQNATSYGPPAFQEEMSRIQKEGKTPW
jgi:hypothetical protein